METSLPPLSRSLCEAYVQLHPTDRKQFSYLKSGKRGGHCYNHNLARGWVDSKFCLSSFVCLVWYTSLNRFDLQAN